MLTQQFSSLLQDGWQDVFAQARSHHRMVEHALALPCTLGRHTISQTICVLGRAQKDWSADYKIFSRSHWQPERLFDPVIEDYLSRYPKGPIVAAFDDTKLAKTGKKIVGAFWQRDPMSPPFHVNFIYGLRFIQGALLFPHYRGGDFSARAYPVCFHEAAPLKKPGKRATPEQRRQYQRLRRKTNLSTQTLQVIQGFRAELDAKGASGRPLLATLDGSFCNQTLFKTPLDRIQLLARCRKDARLCFAAPPGSRRKYAKEIFSPEQVRQDTTHPWKKASIYFGGKWRRLRYKEVQAVLWKRGSARRQLRLIVIAPVPYKLSPKSPTNYRDPAYLLSTDWLSSGKSLVQAYFDRWQIEVNHRDEKDLLGVGQAQVRSALSVPRHPAFAVATYSLLLLAALRTFGPARTQQYTELPKWRKEAKRPSLLDILTLIRKEINETSVWALLPQNSVRNVPMHVYN
jgi:hypothetical protein